MSTTVRCSVCGRTFSSTRAYQDHLPCHGSKALGGAGDVYKGQQETAKEGGTRRG